MYFQTFRQFITIHYTVGAKMNQLLCW